MQHSISRHNQLSLIWLLFIPSCFPILKPPASLAPPNLIHPSAPTSESPSNLPSRVPTPTLHFPSALPSLRRGCREQVRHQWAWRKHRVVAWGSSRVGLGKEAEGGSPVCFNVEQTALRPQESTFLSPYWQPFHLEPSLVLDLPTLSITGPKRLFLKNFQEAQLCLPSPVLAKSFQPPTHFPLAIVSIFHTCLSCLIYNIYLS